MFAIAVCCKTANIRPWLFSSIATDWCTVTDIIQSKLSINVCGCFQTKGFVFSLVYGQKIGTNWVVVAFSFPIRPSVVFVTTFTQNRLGTQKRPPQLKGSWQQWLRHSALSTIWSKLLAELTPFAACKSVHIEYFFLPSQVSKSSKKSPEYWRRHFNAAMLHFLSLPNILSPLFYFILDEDVL